MTLCRVALPAFVALLLWCVPHCARAQAMVCGAAAVRCENFNPAMIAQKALGDQRSRNCGATPSPTLPIAQTGIVTLASGNLYRQEQDYQGTGPFPLSLTRHYNSQLAGISNFGLAWRLSYMRALVRISSGVVRLVRDDGQTLSFTLQGARWVPDIDVNASLTQTGLVVKGGGSASELWVLRGCGGEREIYSAAGRLLGIVNRAGLRQSLTYDRKGRLQSVSDPAGRTISFSYGGGASAPQIGATLPDGTTTIYTLDAENRLSSVTRPDGAVVGYLYENSLFARALTGVIDELGNRVSTISYDAQGRVIAAQGFGGADAVQIDDSQLGSGGVSWTNALGGQHVVSLRVVAGTPLQVAHWRNCPANCANYYSSAAETTSFDLNGNPTATTDLLATSSAAAFDPVTNLMLRRTEAVGQEIERSISTSWNLVYRRAAQIVAPGRTITNFFDAAGNLTQHTVSAGGASRSWSYGFNAAGQRISSTDPLGNTTLYGYDSQWRLVSITNPAGQALRVSAFDANGRPSAIVDANGVLATLSTNARGQITAVTRGGATTTARYDAAGQLVALGWADGSMLGFAYDGAHRLVGVSDGLGNAISYGLDNAGNRISVAVTDAAGTLRYEHGWSYDPFGRLLADVGAAGQTRRYLYNADDSLSVVTDPLGHATVWAVDGLGRRIARVDATGAQTSFNYDSLDHLVGIVDALGNSTAMLIDGFDQLTERVSPDSGVSLYGHDEVGDETETIDARGVVGNTSFDSLQRPLITSYAGAPGETVTRVYDGGSYGVGRLSSMTDAAGSLALGYDQRGNLTSQTRIFGGVRFSLLTSFDPADRVAAIAYPSGLVVHATRDAMGRISALTATPPGGASVALITNVGYQPFGPPRGWRWFNGVSRQILRDLDGRVSQVIDGGAAAVKNIQYSYDLAGNLAGVSDLLVPSNSQSLVYDAVDRLVSATGTYGVASFSYDVMGNRLADQGAVYTLAPGSNLLAGAVAAGGGTLGFAYTAAGQLAAITQSGETATQFTYTQAGRVETVSENGVLIARNLYDGFNRRAVRTDGAGVSTVFIHDQAGHLLEEASAAGVALLDTIWLDDEPVAVFNPAAGTFLAVHTNAQGVPEAETDARASVVWSASWQPFGAPATQTGVVAQALRLPGQYADADSGLYQAGARDYAPSLGRFVQPAPFAALEGGNPNSYARDNPLRFIQPDGIAVRDLARAGLSLPVPTILPAVRGALAGLGDPI